MTTEHEQFDVVVVGGGVNGTGIAMDAAGRGLKVLLCEMNDLASATSSSSSKLIHHRTIPMDLKYSRFDSTNYFPIRITNRKFNLLKGKTGLSYAVQVDNQSDPNADYLHGELYKINAGHFNSLDRCVISQFDIFRTPVIFFLMIFIIILETSSTYMKFRLIFEFLK